MLDMATLTAASTTCAPHRVTLQSVDSLRPSEHVDSAAVEALALRIETQGLWLMPISVEAGTGWVMDGNHRLRAAYRLGLSRVPCVALHYDDPRVRVFRWVDGAPITPESITRMAREGLLLPFKTTRHVFDPPLPATSVPLAELR